VATVGSRPYWPCDDSAAWTKSASVTVCEPTVTRGFSEGAQPASTRASTIAIRDDVSLHGDFLS
jgi:hypothetical protein